MIRRREFITLLGGAAAWPVLARAQLSSARVRRIGVLMGGTEGDASGQRNLAEFKESLRRLGWAEGRNIEFDIRWAGADGERRTTYAAEIVSRAPDAILSSTAPVTQVLQRATATIPIVMASGADIAGNGVVTDLARPQGNITGFPATGSRWAANGLICSKAWCPARRASQSCPRIPIPPTLTRLSARPRGGFSQ
jgi:putative ABC transport system substrate-binding protein